MLNKEDLDSILVQYTENARIPCPVCSETRKKKGMKSMTVTMDGNTTLYHCHHCGLAGKTDHPDYRPQAPKVRAISVPKTTDKNLISKCLSDRGIDPSVVDRYPVVSGTKFYHNSGEQPSIGFVYGNKEAVKWRSVEGKAFTQDGAARTLWGADQVPDDATPLVIVGGGMALLACAAAGIDSSGSVTHRAPQEVSTQE